MDKIIHKIINEFTEGVDTYTHNGSTWLIFTESKQWVIELTEDKTLWYNYNFFKEVFEYTSMDVVENQHYITKWVENNIINKVKETSHKRTMFQSIYVEDTIQNGVKETDYKSLLKRGSIEDTIENGVKYTTWGVEMNELFVDDAIENGVKHTRDNPFSMITNVENTIQNGVRHTLNTEYMPTSMVEDIIENGVKETKGHGFEQQNIIDDIVKDGVKETKTPGKDGDILSTIEWMEENKTNSVPKMIDDVIENGEKINGTFVGGKRQKENIESVIGYGTKNPSI